MNALLLASALIAAPAQQAADTITPTFEWPAGTVLRAEITAQQTTSQDGQVQASPEVQLSGTRTISDHPQGLLVTSSVEGEEASTTPAYLLTDDGTFIGVEGAEAMVAQMREQMLAQVRAQTGGTVPPEAQAMAERMFSEESVNASAREEHQLLVGWWAGRTWTRNRVQLVNTTTQDALTQATVPTEAELVWRGYAPCAPGEASDSCIELEVSLFPDTDEIATAFENTLGAQNPGGLFVNRAEAERTVRILAQPGGMVPRRVEDVTNAAFDIEVEGQIIELAVEAEEVTTFTVGGGLGGDR